MHRRLTQNPDIRLPEPLERICSRLQNAGREVYVVGGAVRDTLLGRPVADWDLCAQAPHELIRKIFADTRHFIIQSNTVTLLIPGGKVEVTPFKGGGHSLDEDLSHRDFTVNAIAFDPASRDILDPLGGRKDLAGRQLRAVGDAKARFIEDPLRLLRAVRLSLELGFRIEPHTLRILTRLAPLIDTVASERSRDELLKILLAPRCSRHLVLLRKTGLLRQLIPELMEGHLLRQSPPHHYTILRHAFQTVDAIRAEPVLRFAALLHDVGKPRVRSREKGTWRFYGHAAAGARISEKILFRLKFSAAFIKQVTRLIEHHMLDYGDAWSDAAVRRLIRRVGPEALPGLLALRRADLRAHGTHPLERVGTLNRLEARLARIQGQCPALSLKDLAVDGHTVMQVLGIGPGPQVGEALAGLLERVSDDPSLNRETTLRSILEIMRMP